MHDHLHNYIIILFTNTGGDHIDFAVRADGPGIIDWRKHVYCGISDPVQNCDDD